MLLRCEATVMEKWFSCEGKICHTSAKCQLNVDRLKFACVCVMYANDGKRAYTELKAGDNERRLIGNSSCVLCFVHTHKKCSERHGGVRGVCVTQVIILKTIIPYFILFLMASQQIPCIRVSSRKHSSAFVRRDIVSSHSFAAQHT